MAASVEEPSEDIVAKSRKDRASQKSIFGRIRLFIQQVFNELKKVSTPSRSELIKYTAVVLVFVVIMMAVIGLLDWLFGMGVVWLFGGGLTGS